jgi:uncharacterized protein YkwD
MAILSFITFSCKKEDLPANNETTNVGSGNTGGTTPAPDIVYNVSKSKMLQLINNVRKTGCNCGTTTMPPVTALTWNDKLAKASYDHSVEMKNNNYFVHRPEWSCWATAAAGYTGRHRVNIAKGYTTDRP